MRKGEKPSRIPLLPELAIEYPQIQIQSNKEAVIEGCRGIIEYSDEIVRLNVDKMELKVYGRDLNLKCLTGENIVITGRFERIEYAN